MGGTGLFIQDKLHYTKREDLTTSKQEFEAFGLKLTTIHIETSYVELYIDTLVLAQKHFWIFYNVIEKINRENKYCILMGDFNINLLNFESHPATEMSLILERPQILQPTRITDHSATLIDNIF